MERDFKEALFQIINDFNKGAISLEWPETSRDADILDALNETLNNIIYHAALLPGFKSQEQRETAIGKLAIIRSNLLNVLGIPEQNDALQKYIKQLEQSIRDIMNQTQWLKEAQERYEAFAELYDEADEDARLTPEQINYLRPVFFAFDLLALITFEPLCQEGEEDEGEFEFEYEENEEPEDEDEL